VKAYTYEPNFQETFWGTNYPRLLAIKRKVDPHDVFWCQPCVGNERWEVVDDMLCKIKVKRDMRLMEGIKQ
jgi:Berberine and berberine like